MRWRTVDGIQTEERADTPLGEYRVKAGGGRWAWYHESLDWAPVKSCDEAKREAEQHFYTACEAALLVRTGIGTALVRNALEALGIAPPPEPLVWHQYGDSFSAIRDTTQYVLSRVVCNRWAAHRVNASGDKIEALGPVGGSLDECKAACERDREASCR